VLERHIDHRATTVNASGESAVSSSQAAPAAESRATSDRPRAPYFSGRGFVDGAIAMTPVLLSLFATGLVFGTLATQKGLTLVETVAMSGMVYSGLAQVVSLQSWPHDITFATVLTLMLVTLTVNLRFFLMSLTFRPWFSGLPAWQAYPALLFMTDVGWLRAMRYRGEGGGDVGFFLGGGLLLYLVWLASTATGFVFSSWLTNPKAFGIDLLLPTFFATLLIPAWRGVRRAVPWLVAGLVAAAVEHFVAGYWYIIAGALCGAVAAGLSGDA
jgi:predicted branched-subunit amino acid permease